MEFPRWIVGSLLVTIIVAILLATWWWITWPRMTSDRFLAAVREARFDDANSMLVAPARFIETPASRVVLSFETGELSLRPDDMKLRFREPILTFEARGPRALLAGVVRFRSGALRFTARDGIISATSTKPMGSLAAPNPGDIHPMRDSTLLLNEP